MATQNSPKRALISVSDKTGIVEFARQLLTQNIDLISTGGTYKALKDAGLTVTEVKDITGFPEIMDGRVKTLHLKIHGGLLANREKPEHLAAMQTHGITGIDILAVNLYPFQTTSNDPHADYADCIEDIDIGGPAMIRAAAKNHAYVAVITDPADYTTVAAALQNNTFDFTLRQRLAAKAYSHTANYDGAIAHWFQTQLGDTPSLPFIAIGTLHQTLRYGENPHQTAALYLDNTNRIGVATAVQIQGKELSYNNINDTDAAFECVAEFQKPAVAIIKHANPCGVAEAADLTTAYQRALRCDPVSAFGGIIALNQTLDAQTAAEIGKIFTEVIIAPGITDDARDLLAKKSNLRVLSTNGLPDVTAAGLSYKSIAGGLLVQSRDNGRITESDLRTVTKRAPTKQELQDLLFAWRVAKHVKSNAIIYVKDGATVGVGAGQMSRVDSARIAAQKAAEATTAAGLDILLTTGSAVASDAFFPFADGLLELVKAGATAVIQPGGSKRDDEVIAAADAHGIAMVMTGMRHFRH